MSRAAKWYIAGVVCVGAVMCLQGLSTWHAVNPWRFLAFFLVAMLGAQWKIVLPGLTGSMSVNFCFVLAGILEYSLAETLIVGLAAILVQLLWARTSKLRPIHIAFNMASVSFTIFTSYYLFRLPALNSGSVEFPVLLAIEATWYFLANTMPVAMAIALTEGRPFHVVWRECYFWSLPYYLIGAALAGCFHVWTRVLGWQTSLLIIPIVYMVYRSYNLYLKRLNSEKKHAEQMASLHLRTIEALALAIDAKDQTTHDHLQRVQVYAFAIGQELGLAQSDMEALRAAALLHDIGKLAVPEHIISKPGKLTPEEFEKMKIHPVVGAEILERVQFPYPVVPIVRSHHERWNGSGYPDGLKGNDIPIGARILSAVDCLDALASDRQYRRALPLDEAMAVVVKESGVSFDPQVVEILQRRYRDLEFQARGTVTEGAKLSTDVKIERGDAPAAGFESAAPGLAVSLPEKKMEFLSSIGAARHEVQTLFEVAQNLGNSLSMDETLSLVAARLRKVVPYDALAIYLKSEDQLLPSYVTGEELRLFSSLRIPVGQGLSGWVAENKKPILNGNPSVEPGYLNDPNKFSAMRSALAVPLEGLNGIVGVLTLYRCEKDSFTKDNQRVMLGISSKLALSIENNLKYKQAEENATTDFLTGLPNVRSLYVHLESEVERCTRLEIPLTVLVADLNGFREIKDRFGHVEGDQTLRSVAVGLRQCCREQDYLARMGGDEFVMVLPGLSAATAAGIVGRLQESVKDIRRANATADVPLSLSIGCAELTVDGLEADNLLAAADRRMYRSKNEHLALHAKPLAVPTAPVHSQLIH